MTSQLALPVELLEQILDDLDVSTSSGKEALSSFSRSNYAFSILCQKRLFYDVRIPLIAACASTRLHPVCYRENLQMTATKLLEVLDHSPRIATYIFTVTIAAPWRLVPGRATMTSESPMFSLYSIMPKLSSLKALTFELRSGARGPPSYWPDLEPRVRMFLTAMVENLSEINISQYSKVPSSLFTRCSRLQNVVMSDVLMDNQDTPLSGASSQLCSLEVRDGHATGEGRLSSWIMPGTCPFDITRLTTLRLFSRDFGSLPVIFSQCSRTLQVLELGLKQPRRSHGELHVELYLSLDLTEVIYSVTSQFSFSDDDPIIPNQPSPPNFSGLQSLQNLTLHSVIGRPRNRFSSMEDSYYTTIPYMASALDTLPDKPRSPTLKITFKIYIQDVEVNELESIAWPKLLGYICKERHALSGAMPIELVWDRSMKKKRVRSMYVGDNPHRKMREILDKGLALEKADFAFTSFPTMKRTSNWRQGLGLAPKCRDNNSWPEGERGRCQHWLGRSSSDRLVRLPHRYFAKIRNDYWDPWYDDEKARADVVAFTIHNANTTGGELKPGPLFSGLNVSDHQDTRGNSSHIKLYLCLRPALSWHCDIGRSINHGVSSGQVYYEWSSMPSNGEANCESGNFPSKV
ncbi:hypothetical protein CVT26_012269 [Gymnopilus dilepis]|uniref:Uncharacterized protein n=1 Tax=Gymnopilus dilepis TaxID=231916 RepID=A0A409YQ99_9AGAR|nr:hypothetical protein CVT26_012269 [Gymnopilus dilepis]